MEIKANFYDYGIQLKIFSQRRWVCGPRNWGDAYGVARPTGPNVGCDCILFIGIYWIIWHPSRLVHSTSGLRRTRKISSSTLNECNARLSQKCDSLFLRLWICFFFRLRNVHPNAQRNAIPQPAVAPLDLVIDAQQKRDKFLLTASRYIHYSPFSFFLFLDNFRHGHQFVYHLNI